MLVCPTASIFQHGGGGTASSTVPIFAHSHEIPLFAEEEQRDLSDSGHQVAEASLPVSGRISFYSRLQAFQPDVTEHQPIKHRYGTEPSVASWVRLRLWQRAQAVLLVP